MTPREVMRAAIRFETPDRLPVEMESLGYTDAHWVGFFRDSEWKQKGEGLDEWGCRWVHTEVPTMGQPLGHPLTDIAHVGDYPLPDPHDPPVYEQMKREIEAAESADKYVVCSQFMVLFERMHALLGFENLLTYLYTEPEAMAVLADRLVEYDMAEIDRAGELFGDRIHCFGGTDDWGTQQALFISPEKWREFFLPRYKRIWDAAHSRGWDVKLHSCGKVNEGIPLMVEAGLDMVNLQQPRALGIEEIGRSLRGKLAFETLNDIQHTLPTGDAAAINAEAELLLEHWATPEGGFVLSDYGDGAAIGVPLATKQVMVEAFLSRDPYIEKGREHPALAVIRQCEETQDPLWLPQREK
jgi:uroporphyrinogen-III decarboxylase